MKRLIAVIITLAVFQCSPIMASEIEADILLSTESVNRVYDGQTFVVTLPLMPELFGKDLPVRLRGVEAPRIVSNCPTEEGKVTEQRLAMAARDRLASILTKGRTLELRNPQRGTSFSLIATVYLDGVRVSDVLETEGLVISTEEDSEASWCSES